MFTDNIYMFLIGTAFMRLKWFLIFGGFCLFFLFQISMAHALDRTLTREEVAKLKKNLAAEPANKMSRRFLMDHYAREKMWADYVVTAQPIQKDLPAKIQLELIQAHLLLKDGKSALSVIGFYQSQNPPSSETKVLEADALLLLALKGTTEVARKQGGVDVITVLREAIRLDPLNKTAYFRWIDVLKTFWTSYAEDALQVYYQLESATKETNGYLDDKCALYVQAALWDQALETCKRGIVQTSPKIETYVNLAKSQAVKESLQDSKKTLKALVTRFPQAVEAHTALADNYFSENNFILAAEHYRASTKLDPSNPDAFLLLAECEFRQKKYLEALEAYKQNCNLSRTLASEFKHATGELRSNYPLHNKYKNVMSSCQK